MKQVAQVTAQLLERGGIFVQQTDREALDLRITGHQSPLERLNGQLVQRSQGTECLGLLCWPSAIGGQCLEP